MNKLNPRKPIVPNAMAYVDAINQGIVVNLRNAQDATIELPSRLQLAHLLRYKTIVLPVERIK